MHASWVFPGHLPFMYLFLGLRLLPGISAASWRALSADKIESGLPCSTPCVEAFRRCAANMTYSFCRQKMQAHAGEFTESICPYPWCKDDPSMLRMSTREGDSRKAQLVERAYQSRSGVDLTAPMLREIRGQHHFFEEAWPVERPTIPTLCSPANMGRCECANKSTADEQGRMLRTFTWWYAGQQRCFTEYVPARQDKAVRPRPVLLNLQCHGNDRLDGVGFQQNSELMQNADRFGFIAIGLSTPNVDAWDFGNGGVVNDTFPQPCSESHSDDIAYIGTVLKHLRRNLRIHDISKVFMKGFSQNSMFAAYAAYCFPEQVAGIWQASSGLAIKGFFPVPPRKETQCSRWSFDEYGEECEKKNPCKACKYFPIYPCHFRRPMVHCVSLYSNDDETVSNPKDRHSMSTLADNMFEVAGREGHDVRLLRFMPEQGDSGGHKPPNNGFDWLAGCLGLSNRCTDTCAYGLTRCVAASRQSNSKAYFTCLTQDLVHAGICQKGCSPTKEMLFLSEKPSMRLSKTFFGEPPGGHFGVTDAPQPEQSMCSHKNRSWVELRHDIIAHSASLDDDHNNFRQEGRQDEGDRDMYDEHVFADALGETVAEVQKAEAQLRHLAAMFTNATRRKASLHIGDKRYDSVVSHELKSAWEHMYSSQETLRQLRRLLSFDSKGQDAATQGGAPDPNREHGNGRGPEYGHAQQQEHADHFPIWSAERPEGRASDLHREHDGRGLESGHEQQQEYGNHVPTFHEQPEGGAHDPDREHFGHGPEPGREQEQDKSNHVPMWVREQLEGRQAEVAHDLDREHLGHGPEPGREQQQNNGNHIQTWVRERPEELQESPGSQWSEAAQEAERVFPVPVGVDLTELHHRYPVHH